MIQPILKGKGRSNDITVLKLLLKYRSLTISQMTKLDGLEQSYPARRQREKVYRRALHGRNDSSDPGLLVLGLANRDGRMIDGKLTGVYSITERGVRELLTVEVFDRGESYVQKILEGKGIDKIIKVALESGIEPISLIPDIVYLTDEGSGDIIEWTWREFRTMKSS